MSDISRIRDLVSRMKRESERLEDSVHYEMAEKDRQREYEDAYDIEREYLENGECNGVTLEDAFKTGFNDGVSRGYYRCYELFTELQDNTDAYSAYSKILDILDQAELWGW